MGHRNGDAVRFGASWLGADDLDSRDENHRDDQSAEGRQAWRPRPRRDASGRQAIAPSLPAGPAHVLKQDSLRVVGTDLFAQSRNERISAEPTFEQSKT